MNTVSVLQLYENENDFLILNRKRSNCRIMDKNRVINYKIDLSEYFVFNIEEQRQFSENFIVPVQ